MRSGNDDKKKENKITSETKETETESSRARTISASDIPVKAAAEKVKETKEISTEKLETSVKVDKPEEIPVEAPVTVSIPSSPAQKDPTHPQSAPEVAMPVENGATAETPVVQNGKVETAVNPKVSDPISSPRAVAESPVIDEPVKAKGAEPVDTPCEPKETAPLDAPQSTKDETVSVNKSLQPKEESTASVNVDKDGPATETNDTMEASAAIKAKEPGQNEIGTNGNSLSLNTETEDDEGDQIVPVDGNGEPENVAQPSKANTNKKKNQNRRNNKKKNKGKKRR